jgi:hypothetical protein
MTSTLLFPLAQYFMVSTFIAVGYFKIYLFVVLPLAKKPDKKDNSWRIQEGN